MKDLIKKLKYSRLSEEDKLLINIFENVKEYQLKEYLNCKIFCYNQIMYFMYNCKTKIFYWDIYKFNLNY